ncbi:MAG: NADH-quinone oxidoreductase subunit M [Deltaproteobacteria bacterium]|nr:NADH-quinone oxidoreductase subunit M [Deltaproteobacteria bacterium]
MHQNLLSLIIFLPLLGAVLLLFFKDEVKVRWFALLVTVLDSLLTIPLMNRFDTTTSSMQFVERYSWIPSWNIYYHLGVDGISILFVFLTAFLGWICVLASWTAIDRKVKEFMIALLVMQTAMLGVFCALDLFLFFLFWEAMLIPMYLIIGVWGGPNRIYSAIKFFLYTFAGGIFLLVGIIALYFAGGGTFDIPALMEKEYPFAFQVWIFLAFFIAFAVKVPMFPFHTWLPDAHVDAPTAGSIVLAGVLLKIGGYGFLRFSLPMFPDASQYFAIPIIILSIIAIIYGGFLALAQEDLKKLIAYSSVSHMGFVTLGIFLFNKNGIEGGILQMFNHGITTSALFLCVGIIYERTHSRLLKDYGWGARLVPIYATFLFIFAIASLGFPGTNGFIGELLILFGAFAIYKPYIIFLLAGIVLGAAYMLWMYQRMTFGADTGHGGHTGEAHNPAGGHGHIWDVDIREAIALLALTLFVFWIGLQPMGFLEFMHTSVEHLIETVSNE